MIAVQFIQYYLSLLLQVQYSAAGPDDIHYQMLKHLPSESL